jgi:arylsulfotransferase ASST
LVLSLSACLVAAAACAVALLWVPSGAPAASPTVTVFPIPGSRVASPTSQLVFRGVPAGQLGAIAVSGSRSGPHSGRILADSDGRGGSFLPAAPFIAGEVVTVGTSLNILGSRNGAYTFTVASPAGGIPPIHWPAAPRVRGDVQRFQSRPDLAPAAISVTKHTGRTQPGNIFLAPQFGPLQDGPMIVDGSGKLVWFKSLSGDDSAADFRVQRYHGRPVLTWWQGYVTAGVGIGAGVIDDSSYRQIATVHAANGVHPDLHEFELTPQGTALITADYPVYWDASAVHGSKHEIVFDSIVQEIDIPTGLLLYEWDSLDHVPVTDSYATPPRSVKAPFDYFHVNTIEPDRDGTLILSARNTWAAYKVNRQNGAVVWRLGGRHSSFKLAPGVSWAFQHDVRVRASSDLFVTLFDDGAGPPRIHRQSRGIKLILDLKHMRAAQVAQHVHSPPLSTNFEGNFQQLANRDDFLGWGQQPYFSEYDPHGRVIFDGRFVGGNASYRAYRFPWTGTPTTPPAVAGSTRGRTTTVYASWNGDNEVSFWLVQGGSSATTMRTMSIARKSGFETPISIRAQRFVLVQALDGNHRVLGQSAVVAVR